jgi:hypothetical protein
MTGRRKLTGRNRILAVCTVGILFFVISSFPAMAQVDVGMEYASAIGLPDMDIRIAVGNIVRALLGFVGFIMVLQLMIAGFKYMTHGGDEDARADAIAAIKNSVIGLFLIMTSASIARFVVSAIIDATTSSYG